MSLDSWKMRLMYSQFCHQMSSAHGSIFVFTIVIYQIKKLTKLIVILIILHAHVKVNSNQKIEEHDVALYSGCPI